VKKSSDKYQNRYRIPSARLQSWDYGNNGFYFITICTAHRINFFGEIINHEMILNDIGHLAFHFWNEIPAHFPFVHLGNFVIMPNHIHGILIINKIAETPNLGISAAPEPDGQTHVQTPNLGISTNPGGESMGKWKPGTIGSIVNQYKRICTINARKINPGFGWQPRFHDHIIRNDQEFDRIEYYITNNPRQWNGDKFCK